jgi:hypothetical protein
LEPSFHAEVWSGQDVPIEGRVESADTPAWMASHMTADRTVAASRGWGWVYLFCRREMSCGQGALVDLTLIRQP